MSVKYLELKLCSNRKIIIQLNQFKKESKSPAFKWEIPLSKIIWWRWFLSAEKGDFLFKILTNITLNVSKTGIFIMLIARTGKFSSFIEKTVAKSELSEVVIYVIKKYAIQNPINREPASPINSFIRVEKLNLRYIINDAIKTTDIVLRV